MAGAGSRFRQAGYAKPKPFIDVDGEPMIVRVLENLRHAGAHYILIARKSHIDAESSIVQRIEHDFNATFLSLDNQTEGTACTVLHARQYINTSQPLIIANSDQITDISIGDFVTDCERRSLDGSILTFSDPARDPKWSFARLDEHQFVVEVQEKRAISEFATVGVYFYRQGRHFVDAAIDMLIAQDRVNNEYYTCPTYNYAIKSGLRIGIYNIAAEQMHGVGTPNDLNAYLAYLEAQRRR